MSSKTPSERKQEILNSVKDVEYYAEQMTTALIKFRLSGDESNIAEMQKGYEKTASQIALNLAALGEVGGIDAEIEGVLENSLSVAVEKYSEVLRCFETGGMPAWLAFESSEIAAQRVEDLGTETKSKPESKPADGWGSFGWSEPEPVESGEKFGLHQVKYMSKYKVSRKELEKAIELEKVRARVFPDGMYVEDVPLYDSKIRLLMSKVGLSPIRLLLLLLVALLLWLLQKDIDVANTHDSQSSIESVNMIDENGIYSVYSGSAGIYESPFVMYLKENDGKYEGRYAYARYQKWLDVSGQKNSEGYIELKESFEGKATGKIVIKREGLELSGHGFWGLSVEGETFKAVLRTKVDSIKASPRDGHYVRKHAINMFNDGVYEESVSDRLEVKHFADKGFSFYLYEVADNGHYGTLSGSAIYEGDKAVFLTNEGCQLTFFFDEKNGGVMYDAKSSEMKQDACYHFGGARNALVHNEFSKVE